MDSDHLSQTEFACGLRRPFGNYFEAETAQGSVQFSGKDCVVAVGDEEVAMACGIVSLSAQLKLNNRACSVLAG